ncbi:MAG: molybdopterin-dependent oxidoreductase [Bacteroidota bacterium]|nr:molybdopterin-dependent oxidoreductase [Bacteroidota bacterium]
MSNRLNVTLNGNKVTGYKDETILELARRNGVNIPTFCNDPRLEPNSSCFVCVVEVKGMRGHQPSCSTKLVEGMEIETDNPGVRKSRKTALELILSNHYADCKAPCTQTCPAGVDVQGYISLVDKGQYSEAVKLIKETNPLPAICGRVCVRPCEAACRRNLLDEDAAVGVDYIKRFAADADLESNSKYIPEVKPSTGKKIAVIGAGPGGLSAAHFLQIEGHQVDIYEGAPKTGGWLRYGIPEYRLPNDILDKEVANITDLGVNIFTNKKLGDNLSYKEIKENYDATVLTIGSQRGTLVGCEGDDAENVFSGIDFLKNMELTGKSADFAGKTVAVVGGGNTAMDCCRTSIRCNAKKVYVIYRRTEKEMPANPIEIHESKLEGVEYLFLTNPKMINKDENGKLKSVTCLKMELGEPDASGRRRPVPIEGSDFELELDYVLAAIGQKTDVNFIDDINKFSDNGSLIVNRWGNIDTDEKTLQTGISSVFAAGDGVTGAATIIEAIAQAQIATHSVKQYLNGAEEILPPAKEFISRKENFKTQDKKDYQGFYAAQQREEMPVLDPKDRFNFKEVELGYSSEEIVHHETQRCLECGCTAVNDCVLKELATEYGADQTKFAGEYVEHKVDFRHPFIEIDNNKCVLCTRCIRICDEIVGAHALGLVERGFKTYVAPAMGDALTETSCESCGMCIDVCPTGAISENVLFKPGPVKTEKLTTVDNFGSEGFELNVHQRNGFVYKTSSTKGEINQKQLISPMAKFGYNYLNDLNRIVEPLIKTEEGWTEISFEEAFKLMKSKVAGSDKDENAVCAGARMTNEELYLTQKFARAAIGTNNISSFHYMGRGDGYANISERNTPFEELDKANKIIVFGTDLAKDHPLVGYLVNDAKAKHKAQVEFVTTDSNSDMSRKADKVISVASYYHFAKAINHYLLKNNMQNGMFLTDHVENFEEYKKQVLAEDFDALLTAAAPENTKAFEEFVKSYDATDKTVVIFSEKQVSANTALELKNMAMISGKLGKTANGIIALKEKNNSQGLFDMGVSCGNGVGNQPVCSDEFREHMKQTWDVETIPEKENDLNGMLTQGKIKNLFIFGEDPMGCASDTERAEKMFASVDFMVVQDMFMSETAELADLVLPASTHLESAGSFTSTQKRIQLFDALMKPKVAKTNIEQLIDLLGEFGVNSIHNAGEALDEAFTLLSTKGGETPLKMNFSTADNHNRNYDFGCDVINKRIGEEFEQTL